MRFPTRAEWRLFLRQHPVAIALTCAVIGLLMIAGYQRSRTLQVESNTRRIDSAQRQLDELARRTAALQRADQQRLFDSCVRSADLRRHVNDQAAALRRVIAPALHRTLTRKQRAQVLDLLSSITISPGPESRRECVLIAPPPAPKRARRSEVAP